MWQRSQTLFMLLAVVVSVVLLFVSVGYFSVDDNIICVKAMGINGAESFSDLPDTMIYFSVVLVSIILTIVAITQFKNRSFQSKLLLIAMVFQPITIGLGYFLLNQVGAVVSNGGEALTPSLDVGMILPFITLIALFLARKAVIKDEELIKSVDRLR